jgi:hypothetical protein
MARYLVQLDDRQTSGRNDDQNGEQATDGYDHATPPSVAPAPAYHLRSLLQAVPLVGLLPA